MVMRWLIQEWIAQWLGLRDRLRRVNCDALGIQQISLACARGCGAEHTANRALAGIDVLEEARGHGGDF